MTKINTIIDVRTPAEFMDGNVIGSWNIPLQEMLLHLDKIKQMPQPVVLCCASGSRSSIAATILRENGIECENGGSWFDVNYRINEI